MCIALDRQKVQCDFDYTIFVGICFAHYLMDQPSYSVMQWRNYRDSDPLNKISWGPSPFFLLSFPSHSL